LIKNTFAAIILEYNRQPEMTNECGGKSLTSDSRPLILVTNDDGIQSPGLRAAAAALHPLADLLVAAPLHQQSGLGRSFPIGSTGRIHPMQLTLEDGSIKAFGIEGSPAQTVARALIELAPRQPDLCVVGINYGENVGNGITGSGTVGAALEAASAGIPALAVSVQTAVKFHYSHSEEIDFGAATHFARIFAQRLLSPGFSLPFDADLLKIDIPQGATPDTAWRITRVSRQRYFEATPPQQKSPSDECGPLSYRPRTEWSDLEPDSDIYALLYDRVVSVAPVSLDLSARVDKTALEQLLRGDL
jgi:5'-nucleotidase